MPAPFHALRDQAIAAVDGVMAEEVSLLFLDGRGRADEARENVSVRGVLRTGAGSAISPTDGQAWGRRLAAGKALLHVARSEAGASLLRQGDKVRAIERAGSPLWEVLRVDDRDHGRLVFELGEA